MKLDSLDISILAFARDGALPMSEVWRQVGQQMAYESFRYRIDRLARNGLINRRKAFGRIFVQTSPGGVCRV